MGLRIIILNFNNIKCTHEFALQLSTTHTLYIYIFRCSLFVVRPQLSLIYY